MHLLGNIARCNILISNTLISGTMSLVKTVLLWVTFVMILTKLHQLPHHIVKIHDLVGAHGVGGAVQYGCVLVNMSEVILASFELSTSKYFF